MEEESAARVHHKMKTVVDQQREEVEKAVISTGEYTLKPRFGGLRVEQSTFYRMNEKQRCTP